MRKGTEDVVFAFILIAVGVIIVAGGTVFIWNGIGEPSCKAANDKKITGGADSTPSVSQEINYMRGMSGFTTPGQPLVVSLTTNACLKCVYLNVTSGEDYLTFFYGDEKPADWTRLRDFSTQPPAVTYLLNGGSFPTSCSDANSPKGNNTFRIEISKNIDVTQPLQVNFIT